MNIGHAVRPLASYYLRNLTIIAINNYFVKCIRYIKKDAFYFQPIIKTFKRWWVIAISSLMQESPDLKADCLEETILLSKSVKNIAL